MEVCGISEGYFLDSLLDRPVAMILINRHNLIGLSSGNPIKPHILGTLLLDPQIRQPIPIPKHNSNKPLNLPTPNNRKLLVHPNFPSHNQIHML